MKVSLRKAAVGIGVLAVVVGVGVVRAQRPGKTLVMAKTDVATLFSTTRLLEHIRVLSSDKFQGRAPGTIGEQLSIQYIQSQFKKIGLAPGNPDGSYLQKVPLERSSSRSSARGSCFCRDLATTTWRGRSGSCRR